MPPVIRRVWCLVKSAPIRKEPRPDGEIIDRVSFGQVFYIGNCENMNGYMNVMYLRRKIPTETFTYGWVSRKALTECKVEDYAGLFFINNTGRSVPTFYRHDCKKPLWKIKPGETVSMIARVGNLCLTNRGWTSWKWLEKKRYIIDQQAIDDVMLYVLTQAVKDYKSIVKKIKKHKYHTIVSFVGLATELEQICVFFLDKQNVMNCDNVPGRERLDDLNEELGIDMKWVLKQVDKADAWRNRERDSTGRHKKPSRAAQKRGSVLPENGNHD